VPDSRAPVAVILDESDEASAVAAELGDGSASTDGDSTTEVFQTAEPITGASSPGPALDSQVDLATIEGQIVKVSISHDGPYCTAVALAPEMH